MSDKNQAPPSPKPGAPPTETSTSASSTVGSTDETSSSELLSNLQPIQTQEKPGAVVAEKTPPPLKDVQKKSLPNDPKNLANEPRTQVNDPKSPDAKNELNNSNNPQVPLNNEPKVLATDPLNVPVDEKDKLKIGEIRDGGSSNVVTGGPSAPPPPTTTTVESTNKRRKDKKKKKKKHNFKSASYFNWLAAITAGVVVAGVVYLTRNGTPPTTRSYESSLRALIAGVAGIVLGIVGFIIINREITSIILALAYVAGATYGIYASIFIISRSIDRRIITFNDIVEFSVDYYLKQRTEIRHLPAFVDYYQFTKKCCGWGKFHWMKWAKELNTTDLPDTCCRRFRKGCGRGILTRRRSGFVEVLSTDPRNFSIYSKLHNMDRWRDRMRVIESYWRVIKPDDQRTSKSPDSDHYLRLIDEEFANFYHYENSGYIYVNISLDYEYTLEEKDRRLKVYVSKGLSEFYNIRTVVHPKPCESTRVVLGESEYKLPDKHRGVDPKVDTNMVKDVIIFLGNLVYGGVGLGVAYSVMILVFIYYFQKLSAFNLAEETIPVDFQELNVLTYSFLGNPRSYLNKTFFERIEKIESERLDNLKKKRADLVERSTELKGMHEEGIRLKRTKLRPLTSYQPSASFLAKLDEENKLKEGAEGGEELLIKPDDLGENKEVIELNKKNENEILKNVKNNQVAPSPSPNPGPKLPLPKP